MFVISVFFAIYCSLHRRQRRTARQLSYLVPFDYCAFFGSRSQAVKFFGCQYLDQPCPLQSPRCARTSHLPGIDNPTFRSCSSRRPRPHPGNRDHNAQGRRRRPCGLVARVVHRINDRRAPPRRWCCGSWRARRRWRNRPAADSRPAAHRRPGSASPHDRRSGPRSAAGRPRR